MKTLGRHIVAELSMCDEETLRDLDRVRAIMVRAALAARATIREVAFHKFEPHGVSGVVVLAESHLSIHTWPEARYAALDIYTCGEKADPWKACDYLAEKLMAQGVSTTVMERGIPTPFGRFGHQVSSPVREEGLRVAQPV